MQLLSTQSFEEIRRWMYRNARPLELARWQYHFENGSRENVLQALSVYQNEDGGFGHALEADNWNLNSSPYSTGVAIEIFRELGIYNPHNNMVKKTFEFLDSGEYFTEKGWLFAIPTNSNYPHAPWWSYSEENNEQNGYHATGGLVGYILRCGDTGSRLYKKALSVADGMLNKLRRPETLDIHEVGAYCILLEDVLSVKLSERFDSAYLCEQVSAMVNNSIERDPAKWPRYSMRPSRYIDSPNNLFYNGNEEIAEKELDYILSSRNEGGVWDITWKWEGYPKEFAIAERWWKGFRAIHNMLVLKKFCRLEEALKERHERMGVFDDKKYTIKENVAVYYTKNMDVALKWFKDILGWHGGIIDRNEEGAGVYGFVSDMPQELVVSHAVSFQGFHMWYGEPQEKTIAMVQVQGIESLFRCVKQNGWNQISENFKSDASSETCVITTPDGSTLMFFA